MRITYRQLCDINGWNNSRIKVLREREQIALAFGRSDAFASLFYISVDLVAARLTEVLSEKVDRKLAADIVRDQWGVWMRVVAVAEAVYPAPVFFYVIEYGDKNRKPYIGKDGNPIAAYLTTGSMLDSRKEQNLREIAVDIRKRFEVTPLKFVAIEMQHVLDDVKLAAKQQKVDIGSNFLPPHGSRELEELLKPYDDAMPDRAIVITAQDEDRRADAARRAGILARAGIEANMPKGRLQ